MGNFSDRIFDRRRQRLNAKPSFVVSTPHVYIADPRLRGKPTPDPKLKGKFGGNCNVTHCQAPGAYSWSMNNQAFYCDACANTLNRANHEYWHSRYGVDRFVFRLDTLTPEERAKWEAKGAYVPAAP